MLSRLTSRIVAAAVLSAGLAAQSTPWVVGQPLPDLRLPTIAGGDAVALSSLRGQRLLLIEFASW